MIPIMFKENFSFYKKLFEKKISEKLNYVNLDYGSIIAKRLD